MPTYEITAPDGKRFEVTGDGTAEEALAHFQSQYKSQAEEKPSSPVDEMSGGQRFMAGLGKAFVDLGRGFNQLNTNYAGPSPEAKFGLGQDTAAEAMASRAQAKAAGEQQVLEQRAQDAPLMQTGMGQLGNLTGNIAVAAPTAFIPGANTVAGAGLVGAGLGMLQPAASDQERLINTGVGAGLGSGGQKLGQQVGGWAKNKIASRKEAAALAKSQNSVRDETLREGMEAGFAVPPATTNPTAMNTALESVAGKAATQSAASQRNQKVTNQLIRADLGIDEAAPLTRETLKSVRTQAGKAYEAIKQSGEVIADEQYLDDIIDIVGDNPEITKAFPGAKVAAGDEVVKLADSLMQEKFSAGTAIEYAKRLRSQARDNFKSAYASGGSAEKLQLAHAQWNAAGALEDAIGRNLAQKGMGELAENFQQARVLIAKSHSAEAALNEGTGNIVANKLVQQLKKGKPLSGGFETIAKFASAAPKAMAEPTQSGGVSKLNAMLATIAVLSGHPEILAAPAASLATKRALLSKAIQRRRVVPQYRPGLGGTVALQSGRGLGRIGGPLAASAYASEQ